MATLTREETYPRLQGVRSADGLLSWVRTTDHKRIGILYLLFSLFFLGLTASRRFSFGCSWRSRTTIWFPPRCTTSS